MIIHGCLTLSLYIDNAGVMNVPYLKTVDGFESQCQIVSKIHMY